jgi:GTP-binding protein HflX
MLQTAIIAKRVTEGDPDTAEIRQLTEAAGARVVGEYTQTRRPDPGTELGAGKVTELAERVETTGADTVVVDAALSPQQTVTLEDRLGARVVDRHRVVLEIFAGQARTRRAQLQVELARLRYRLPRVRERADEGALNRFTESGTPYYDLLDRIDELDRKLDDLPSVAEQHRSQRQEDGFDTVALAGYTNAGKSTLLRQLAADLDVDENEDIHPDLDSTAESEDRLFTTPGTTTRKGDIDRRDVLVTDTVGFISDLPHWLVESFKSTLDAVYRADLVLLVVDVSEPMDEIHEKVVTCHDTLYERNEAPIVTVLNKCDTVDDDEITRKKEGLSALAPNPVVISAKTGDGIDRLWERVHDELPDYKHERLVMPMTEDTMSVVSWIHDNAYVQTVEYGDHADEVTVEFEARPQVVEQSRSKAQQLVETSPSA